mmetsp:Transcript_120210/g.335384  ORF Transcript_120210/g.335384 Transcript_120210/m.335384 type:complete len:292 (+) Transcript_120210:1393-2268(+)
MLAPFGMSETLSSEQTTVTSYAGCSTNHCAMRMRWIIWPFNGIVKIRIFPFPSGFNQSGAAIKAASLAACAFVLSTGGGRNTPSTGSSSVSAASAKTLCLSSHSLLVAPDRTSFFRSMFMPTTAPGTPISPSTCFWSSLIFLAILPSLATFFKDSVSSLFSNVARGAVFNPAPIFSTKSLWKGSFSSAGLISIGRPARRQTPTVPPPPVNMAQRHFGKSHSCGAAETKRMFAFAYLRNPSGSTPPRDVLNNSSLRPDFPANTMALKPPALTADMIICSAQSPCKATWPQPT